MRVHGLAYAPAMKATMVAVVCAAACVAGGGCKQSGSGGGTATQASGGGPASGGADRASGAAAGGAGGAGGADSAGGADGAGGGQAGAHDAVKVIHPAPPPRLYDHPVERRLYSDRIEASSFLWTDYNKFQENYHPNYIMDGDPRTAWVEGADSSGAGEWVRIHLSRVDGATHVRLRIQNGYWKSASLYRKNARLETVTVTTLPGHHSTTAQLDDKMAWQEIAFDQPAGPIDAIELRADKVYPGSTYTDLCVSDVEVYVTGTTVENPAFEKSKLESLLGWKKNRLAAAAVLGGNKAAGLPILSGYRVVDGDEQPAQEQLKGANAGLRASVQAARQAAGGALDGLARRADAALVSDFAGWRVVQVVARPKLEVPDVDGLHQATDEELAYGAPDDAFVLPPRQQGSLLENDHLTAFDVKGSDPRKRSTCKPGHTGFLRPPRTAGEGPALTELVAIRCVRVEDREGYATYDVWQLLEYDEHGNLALLIGPSSVVEWFDWKTEQSGRRVLMAGTRVDGYRRHIKKLVDARVVSRN